MRDPRDQHLQQRSRMFRISIYRELDFIRVKTTVDWHEVVHAQTVFPCS